MPADLYCTSGNNASLQGTTVGGSKPLHRFIKGQPKIIGIIALVLGSSFFILSIALLPDNSMQIVATAVPPGFLLGTLFIICGILYILTEHNPTKKTVTVSLALSIVTVLGISWSFLLILPNVVHYHYYKDYEFIEENVTHNTFRSYEDMAMSVELIFLVYSAVGAIMFIVMSCMAVAALRSTKNQALIVMTTTADETPVE